MQNSKLKTDLRERCYQFSLEILKLSDELPKKKSAWIIADQLIRSATSIGANLVEGKGASSRLEFKKFNEIALKSAHETQYWLCLLRDSGLVDSIRVSKLLLEVEELIRMLARGVITLKQSLP
jgi:four helix bundle protein